MKRIMFCILLLVCLEIAAGTDVQNLSGLRSDMMRMGSEEPAKMSLPFSFMYGDQSSDMLLPTWECHVEELTEPSGPKRRIIWDDPQTALRVIWTVLFLDAHNAIEMNLQFEQLGDEAGNVLHDIQPLRQVCLLPMQIITCTGGLGHWWLEPVTEPIPENFRPTVHRLTSGDKPLQINARDGWSSNHHLPFWLTMNDTGQGFFYGLGWTGQWRCRFEPDADGMTIAAGMEHLNLRLHPGERISQPTVLIGSFTGGRWAGHNALRRTLYECYVPELDGRKPLPMVSFNHWFGYGGNNVNEEKMLQAVEMCAPLGIEYVCLDAGWYNVDFWQSGDWRPNLKKFPHGLTPIAEAIHIKGMKMGLWFDPERVTDAAYEAFPRKELLVPARRDKVPAAENSIMVYLLDLTQPAAADWAAETIGHYVETLGIEWIRYDFNYPPLEMWLYRHDDEPDRLGMTEICYIEGLYAFLDQLNRKYPKLCIEWCAGGGRRIDLESLRRTHTQWKSDITGDGNITRAHLTGGNQFLPGNELNSNLIKLESEYDYFCQFGGPLGFGHDFRKDSQEQKALAIKMIKLYKSVRQLLVKDYYPLFNDYSEDDKQWDGWQFHDPQTDEGFFVVLRPENSPDIQGVVKLHGINKNKTYTIVNTYNIQLNDKIKGRKFEDGLKVNIDSARSGILVHYK